MNRKRVDLPEDISSYVEKCYFEWDGVQKILAYITQNNVCTKHLDYYTKMAVEKNYILERAKLETVNEYISMDPSIKFNYEFDFINNCIWYWEEDK